LPSLSVDYTVLEQGCMRDETIHLYRDYMDVPQLHLRIIVVHEAELHVEFYSTDWLLIESWSDAPYSRE
jgi:hypothetical protein